MPHHFDHAHAREAMPQPDAQAAHAQAAGTRAGFRHARGSCTGHGQGPRAEARTANPGVNPHARSRPAAALLLLFTYALAPAAEPLTHRVRVDVPLACAALAQIRAAEYPEVVRVYDQGQAPQSFEEADRAMLGLQWRHRQQFAEDLATQAFVDVFGRPPTADELANERSRWVRTLRDDPDPAHEVLETDCEALFDAAQEWCPTGTITQ